MFFKKSKRIKELESQLVDAQSMLTPEMRDAIKLKETIRSLQSEANNLQVDMEYKRSAFNTELKKLENEKLKLQATLSSLQSQIVECDDEILYQECGLYEPKFIFSNSETYKIELKNIRDKQKAMIKAGNAAIGNMSWTVNGSSAQGSKMVKDMQKLLLRAFNDECDVLVDKVKVNNYDSYVQRMRKACDTISKLGKIMSIAITAPYFDLKLKELSLALDYQQKKEQEKEEAKAERQRLREEAALRKEIEEARKKAQKEKSHYNNALLSIERQLKSATPEEIEVLQAKKAEIENQLNEINKSIENIDYREANQRAGYVYIISNIGSFGKDVYKIGMTRRLEPMDRVDELGDASVPFKFDVHAMIFSDDAPALETALHKAFEDKKVNMVNPRREFFNVSLDEIKAVVKSNFDKTVEFIDFPEAEQYRISQNMRNHI